MKLNKLLATIVCLPSASIACNSFVCCSLVKYSVSWNKASGINVTSSNQCTRLHEYILTYFESDSYELDSVNVYVKNKDGKELKLSSGYYSIDKTKCLIVVNKEAVVGNLRFELSSKSASMDAKARQYIYDRSFSLSKIGNLGIVWGTAWIIDDATPSNNYDYSYYVATNWHVKYGQESISGDYKYCDNSYGCKLQDYIAFKSFNYCSDDTFIFNKGTKPTQAIDFHVAKVDFGNPTSSMKVKLDGLNKYRQTNKHITDFTLPSEDRYTLYPTYIGGYPVDGKVANWEFHKIESNHLETQGYNESPHYIDDKQTLKDCSPNYVMKSQYALHQPWMEGGASGSMLLADIDGHLKVIGIYWGVWMLEYKDMIMPAFSIIRSEYKDFIAPFLK